MNTLSTYVSDQSTGTITLVTDPLRLRRERSREIALYLTYNRSWWLCSILTIRSSLIQVWSCLILLLSHLMMKIFRILLLDLCLSSFKEQWVSIWGEAHALLLFHAALGTTFVLRGRPLSLFECRWERCIFFALALAYN